MPRKPRTVSAAPTIAASWPRPAKIAFIGSHGIRKTTALPARSPAQVQRAGRSVELGREVVRDNPLGINEGATGEAQLWVLVSQVRQELELAPQGRRPGHRPRRHGQLRLLPAGLRRRRTRSPWSRSSARWSATYDLVVRLLPDVALRADGVRSTNDAFRDEIEAILDRVPAATSCRATGW